MTRGRNVAGNEMTVYEIKGDEMTGTKVPGNEIGAALPLTWAVQLRRPRALAGGPVQ
jgi:hypothetical protein